MPERDPARDALRAIYREANDGDLDAFRRSPQRRRRRATLLLAVLLIVIAASLAFAAFEAARKSKGFVRETVRITITAAERTVSGEESVWTVDVANTGSVGLRNAEVDVRYPAGFTFQRATPAPNNDYRNVWTVGAIAAAGTASIRIVGTLLGDVGDTVTMTATLAYQPENFASTFRTDATATTLLADSVLDLTLTSPASAARGQEVAYTVTVRNAGTARIERVQLQLTFPPGLTDVRAEPAADEGAAQWDVGGLDPNGTSEVRIRGALAGDAGTQTELKARVGILDGDGTFRLQRERSALVLLLEPALNISLTVQGGTDAVAAAAGARVPVAVRYSNDSDEDVANATITLMFAGTDAEGTRVLPVETSAIEASKPFVAKNDDAISWTKATIPKLGRLLPGAAGSVEMTLPVRKNVRTLGSGRNLSFQISAAITASHAGGSGGGIERTTDPVTVRISTELRLAAEARYYSDEGVPLGSGPLPPTVGATTHYHLAWFLTNTMNAARDVVLTAALPPSVTFVAADTDANDAVTYDAAAHQVRWRLDTLDPGTGQTLPTREAGFSVSITPTEAEVGTTPTLLLPTMLSATDAFSGASLTLGADALTTALPDDTLAIGKGEVVPPVSVPAPAAPAL